MRSRVGANASNAGSSNFENSVSAKDRRASQTEVATVLACSGSVIVPIPKNLQPTTDSACSVTILGPSHALSRASSRPVTQDQTSATHGAKLSLDYDCSTRTATNESQQQPAQAA